MESPEKTHQHREMNAVAVFLLTIVTLIAALFLSVGLCSLWLRGEFMFDTAAVLLVWTVSAFCAGSMCAALAPQRRWKTGIGAMGCVTVAAFVLTGFMSAMIWGILSGSGGPPVAKTAVAAGAGTLIGWLPGLWLTPFSDRFRKRAMPLTIALFLCLAVVLSGIAAGYMNDRAGLNDVTPQIKAQIEGPIAEVIFGTPRRVFWSVIDNDPEADYVRLKGTIVGTDIQVSSRLFYGGPHKLPLRARKDLVFFDAEFDVPYSSCRFKTRAESPNDRRVEVTRQPLTAAGFGPEFTRSLQPTEYSTVARGGAKGRGVEVQFACEGFPPDDSTVGPGNFRARIEMIRLP